MNNQLFWIGIQESEIDDTSDLFFGSITIFGSNQNNNYALDKCTLTRFDYNKDLDIWFDFVNNTAEKIVKKYPNARFVLYYPMDAVYYSESVKNRLVGYMGAQKLDLWDNKFKCREWLGNIIPVLPNEVCYGQRVLKNHNSLIVNQYVLQGEYSCGGSETWLLSEESWESVSAQINKNRIYSITPYIKNNISVNVHLVVYEQEVLIFPASIQLIKLSPDTYTFNYTGADFISYKYLPQIIKEKVNLYSQKIGEKLRKSGYLGICGIDYITTSDNVYFSEINPRFQSSTFLINKAITRDNSCMQKIHLEAFENPCPVFSCNNINVDFSYYKVLYHNKTKKLLYHIFQHASTYKDIVFVDDKLSWQHNLEENTYLFKLIFPRNICSVSHEYNLIIHPNLCIGDKLFKTSFKKNILEIKIMLLSHGVIIDPKAYEFLNNNGGVNFEEFEAIDMILDNRYYISVPYQANYSQISPFIIKFSNNSLYLYYVNERISKVYIRGTDIISKKITYDGMLHYSEFSYLGNDRLRIYHRLGCNYKTINMDCKFCDIPKDDRFLSIEHITEAIDAYDNCNNIRHYLIGGGSNPINNNYDFVCKIAEYIRTKNEYPINIMSLPITNKAILRRLKKSGITEVTFNIEIFNRKLAKEYMPGKGIISISTYLTALKNAVDIWGTNGNVRTIFIVGLESKESLLLGIETVCRIGVSPILSLFKPIAGTPLEHLLPPSDKEILDIVRKTKSICQKYGVAFGPLCHCCEDNTLKVSEPPNTSQLL